LHHQVCDRPSSDEYKQDRRCVNQQTYSGGSAAQPLLTGYVSVKHADFRVPKLSLHPQPADNPQDKKQTDGETGAEQQETGQTIAISPTPRGTVKSLKYA
jgi:hypothetical protein